jgi:hypothetical protein
MNELREEPVELWMDEPANVKRSICHEGPKTQSNTKKFFVQLYAFGPSWLDITK